MSTIKALQIKKYIRTVFVISILVFILNKFYLRPWVLEKELPEFFNIVVLSIPNLIEAFVGSLLITGILLQLRQYFYNRLGSISNNIIFLAAVGLAGIYSISQEYKVHNIGGNNVFDLYDVLASITGLIIAYAMMRKYGFIEQ